LKDLDYICFYEKPLLKFERLIETSLCVGLKGYKEFTKSMPLWIKEKLFLKEMFIKDLKEIDEAFDENKIFYSKNAQSQAASAFYPSPFDEAVILTIGNVGEWNSASVSVGIKEKINFKKEIHFPHSLGILYSAFTYYLGFEINRDENIVMDLSQYGEPIYVDKINNELIKVKDDGSFKINMKYFNYTLNSELTNKNFYKFFGKDPRKPDEEILQFHMDIASSIQVITENIIDKIVLTLSKDFKIENLCLSGEIAKNFVSNGKLLNKKYFKNIWLQPESGDAGCAIGAALSIWHQHLNKPRVKNSNKDGMSTSQLGPQFSDSEIEKELKILGANYSLFNWDEIINKTSEYLMNGKIIGWFQGRMEFGPNSLGNRSILADPRNKDMKSKINLKVKHRENFRTLSSVVLEDKVLEFFDLDGKSPYMLFNVNLNKDTKSEFVKKNDLTMKGFDRLKSLKTKIPAVTNVDYTSRIQTLNKDDNLKFYELLEEFYKITDCPVLINTSLNIQNEPIACNIKDAYSCLLTSEIDVLVCGNFIIERAKQFEN
jgi:carbamoyltransferase